MEGAFLSGQLLIAMPGIGDPRFERAVGPGLRPQRRARHGPGGEPAGRGADAFRDLLKRLDVTSTIETPPDLVLMGGPVERERGFVLHTDDYDSEHSLQVGGGVALTATREVLEAMAASAGRPRRSLLALGYAGWGAGQLEHEIRENVWLTCDADEHLIFGDDHAAKWARALAKLGVDAALLSSAAGQA